MHDKNGTPLKKGDKVFLVSEIEITDLHAGADFCNVTVKIGGEKPHGADNIQSVLTLNTRQLVLAEKAKTE